jgi:hypothetical protein
MAYVPDPEIFDKAADYIERNGLFQNLYCPVDGYGHMTTENCPMCPWGAVNFLANGNPIPGAGYDQTIAGKAWAWASDFVEEHDLIDRELSIPAWSDREGRTKEEVVALLRTLAEGARRQDLLDAWGVVEGGEDDETG